MAKDSTSSTSDVNALTGPLQTVTLATSDLKAIENFYVKGLGMKLSDPIFIDEESMKKLRVYWDIPQSLDFQVHQLKNSSELDHVPHNTSKENGHVDVRVLVLSDETPTIHNNSANQEVGPYSIGFLNRDIKEVGALMKENSHPSLQNTHIKEAHISNIEGETRKTTMFLGPDFVRTSFLEDEGDGLQHMTFITDQPEKEIEFYTHVLGMDLCSDFQGVSKGRFGHQKAEKIHFRSSTLKSKVASRTAIHILSYNVIQEERDLALRLPHRGIMMYSFKTKDIGEILARAHAKEVKVYRTPRKLQTPIHGEVITMTLLTPTGFIVEVFGPA